MYIATIFLVIPFTVIDQYFGFFYNEQPKCTDDPKLFSLLSIGNWMRFIGTIEGLYLVIFVISILKRKCNNSEFESLYLNRLEEMYGVGIVIKSIICSIVEVILFFALGVKHCTGPVYGYGLSLTCLHFMKMTMVGMSLVRNWCC